MIGEITENTWVESANPSHLELIGKVVVEYSRIEGMMCAIFSRYGGMSEGASKAVTGRLQLRLISEMLATIMKSDYLSNPNLITDIDDIITEISKIAEERNKIVHWEWMIDAAGPGITKFYTAKTPISGLPEITRYSKSELRRLLTRINRLSNRLLGHLMEPEEVEKMPPSLRPPQPWIDKPSLPNR